jgi:hypothetical protein
MKSRLLDPVFSIEEQGDLAMAFDPGHGIDHDAT